jgi:flagellar protein FlaJ
MAFIYLADAQQVHEPVSEWGPYKVFMATLPVMFFMLITMFFPFLSPDMTPPFAKPFMDFIVFLRQTLGLERGFEASLGLGLALIVGNAPAAYAHSHYARRGKGLEGEITNFLRDFTETRKTGASPESCMENLAGRNYGRFTKHLSVASRQIRWGLPFKTIYETLRNKIRSWLALINLYLMVDAIEVGGGTPETMETLTRFSELLSSQEKEKKEMLKPLLIMPYIGAAILLFSTVIFLSFTRTVLYSYAHQAIPFSQFATIIVPPLVLQAYLTGIVTGKISSTTVSAGFKHAVILVTLALVLICFARYLTIPFQGFGG